MKIILTIENNYERMASSLNFASLEDRVRIWRKTLLRSSNVENDDAKHQHELLRYSGMNIRKVEPMMKRVLKILEKEI